MFLVNRILLISEQKSTLSTENHILRSLFSCMFTLNGQKNVKDIFLFFRVISWTTFSVKKNAARPFLYSKSKLRL